MAIFETNTLGKCVAQIDTLISRNDASILQKLVYCKKHRSIKAQKHRSIDAPK